MRITFFSNFLQHHQTPFCSEMVRAVGDGFTFVATERMTEERLTLGYKDVSHDYPYALNSYENAYAHELALQLGAKSDVVIIGSAPEEYVTERIHQNRLTFRYAERFFKQGVWRLFDPRVARASFLRHTRYRTKTNLHLLCAGAYTAGDAAIIGAYPGRCWKWGYFPEMRHYWVHELMQRKNTPEIKLLWVARFIALKHPEKAIGVMEQLTRQGYRCSLDFIGSGELRADMENQVAMLGLQDRIHFLGALSPAEVREYMEHAQIFLFTSDAEEGWGAVLNEAMNSGCAVVASDAIGSVPFLVRHDENGLVYRNRNADDLYHQVRRVVEDAALRERLGRAAVQTIEENWNPAEAAGRLLRLSTCLMDGRDATALFDNGPCSIAV